MIRENRVNLNTRLEPWPAVGGDCSACIQDGGSALGIGMWGEKESARNFHRFLPIGCNLEEVQMCVVLDGRIVPI
jgi:hypothetical protein